MRVLPKSNTSKYFLNTIYISKYCHAGPLLALLGLPAPPGLLPLLKVWSPVAIPQLSPLTSLLSAVYSMLSMARLSMT
jgi:hypothetical protein